LTNAKYLRNRSRLYLSLVAYTYKLLYHEKGLTCIVYLMYLRRQFIFIRREGLYLVIGLICREDLLVCPWKGIPSREQGYI